MEASHHEVAVGQSEIDFAYGPALVTADSTITFRARYQRHQELIALGAANVGAAFTGAYPVAGSFSRSSVNFQTGARTLRNEKRLLSDKKLSVAPSWFIGAVENPSAAPQRSN